jgi:quercetin dioxygenase-like cupin family protein
MPMKHRILFLATFSVAVALLAAAFPDEPAGFVQVLPSGIKWIPSPVVPGTYRAVLLGNPDEAGPFVMRVKVPAGTRIMPHTHREDRVYTVLAGEWKLGFGEKFDSGKLMSFPAGSVYRLPANVRHFQATGQSEAIVQINAIGPSMTEFLNPSDGVQKK